MCPLLGPDGLLAPARGTEQQLLQLSRRIEPELDVLGQRWRTFAARDSMAVVVAVAVGATTTVSAVGTASSSSGGGQRWALPSIGLDEHEQQQAHGNVAQRVIRIQVDTGAARPTRAAHAHHRDETRNREAAAT